MKYKYRGTIELAKLKAMCVTCVPSTGDVFILGLIIRSMTIVLSRHNQSKSFHAYLVVLC